MYMHYGCGCCGRIIASSLSLSLWACGCRGRAGTIVACLTLCVLFACGGSMLAAADSDAAWGEQETPVDDPIGLGERLALIDFLRDEKAIAIPQDASLADLRRLYWQDEAHKVEAQQASERDRITRLRHSLEGQYAISIEEGISWDALCTLKDFHEQQKKQRLHALQQQQVQQRQAQQDTERTQAPAASGAIIHNIKNIKRAVVLIATQQNTTGTGFFIHHRGFLITNRHVVGAHSVGSYATVYWDSSMNKDPENFDIIAVSTTRDLALLKPRIAGQSYRSFSLSHDHSIGTDVISAGFPLGAAVGNSLGTNSFDLTITKGSINSIKRKGEMPWLLQNDCAVSQGCSGGPLLNSANNKVLGVTTLLIDPKNNGNVGSIMGFAIPAQEIRNEFRRLLP